PAAPRREDVIHEAAVTHDDLADAPAVGRVAVPGAVRGGVVPRHAHHLDSTIAPMSAPGIFRPPAAVNEPIRSYLPGSPERAELKQRLDEMAAERLAIPLVIGGERVESGTTFEGGSAYRPNPTLCGVREAVIPHDRNHVLADVAKGDASHVDRAIAAARAAHPGWASTPWHERVAVF